MLMRKLKFSFESVYFKIFLMNALFALLLSALLFYNSGYLKQMAKQNIDQSNQESLRYMMKTVDMSLSKIKQSVYALGIDNDLHAIVPTEVASSATFTELIQFVRKLGQLNRLLPYDSKYYVFSKRRNDIIGADGTRSLDLFYEKLKKESPDFACDCLHQIDEETLSIWNRFIIFSYPLRNSGVIFVYIDKRSLEAFLQDSTSILNNELVITNRQGEIFASNRMASEPTVDDKSMATLVDDMNGLIYTLRYPESIIQEKLKTTNTYILFLFVLFFLINLGFIVVNLSIYKPIRKTIVRLNTSNSSMERYISEHADIMEQNTLLRLASGGGQQGGSSVSVIDKINPIYKNYHVIACVIENKEGIRSHSIIERFEETLKGHCRYQKLLHRSDLDFYIVYDEPQNIRSIIEAVFAQIAGERVYLMCGISHLFADVRDLHAAVEESLNAIYLQQFDCAAPYFIAYYPELPKPKDSPFVLPFDKEQELITCVLKGNIDCIDDFFTDWLKNASKKLSYKEIRDLYRYIEDLLNIMMARISLKQEQAADPDNARLTVTFDILYIHERLKQQYLGVAATSLSREDLYAKIVRYIEENYKLDLSLTMVAEQFFITPGYLSSYFKKHSGYNLSYYINHVRIQAATAMMASNQNVPIKEVAEKVGYSSANTFLRQFKRLSGTTPTQYLRDR